MIDRNLVAEVVIMAALCAGSWFVFIQPRAERLADLETRSALVRADPVFAQLEDIETIGGRLDAIRARVTAIESRGRYGRSPGSLYTLVMGLGTSHEVEIQRITPGSGGIDEPDEDGVLVTTLEVGLAGSFENVAGFLEALGDCDAFIRMTALSLLPTGGAEGEIDCRVVCELVSFEAPDELTLSHTGDTP